MCAARLLLDYPLSLFLEQLHQANEYRGVGLDAGTTSGCIVHKVRESSYDVVLDPPACSCGYLKSMGFPSRHYLCLANVLFKDDLPTSAFHVCWTAANALDETPGCTLDKAAVVDSEYDACAAEEEYVELHVQYSS